MRLVILINFLDKVSKYFSSNINSCSIINNVFLNAMFKNYIFVYIMIECNEYDFNFL